MREELSTLGSPPGQYVASTDGLLAREEAVLALPLSLRRLVFDTLLDETGLENGTQYW